MSFSLGFDDVLSNNSSSYQGSPFHGSSTGDGFADYGASFGGAGPIGTGEEAMSTAFSRGSSVSSASQDLKDMLDSNKDGLKVEAMKRLVSMIARGKNESVARSLFPCVVKCVVTKNPELKKLVYAYLVRFGESEPDLALLSVSSFQRSLKDPNPLIRGSALRVLSSIRVPVIAPLILSAIKESSSDMSPYVRKTAALSIPKLVSLDPEMREEGISLIERLLKDRTSHVLGSVVAALREICPERLDLIHPHYRKLVSLLPDFDEWGQVILIQLLTRYARTQFTDPFRLAFELKRQKSGKKREEKSEGEQSEEEESEEEEETSINMDNDLRMLLKNSRPLLQSRNSSVVFSVLQLHLAIFLAPPPSIHSVKSDPKTHCTKSIKSDLVSEDGSNTDLIDEVTDEVKEAEVLVPDVESARALKEIRNQLIPQWMAPCVKPLIRLIASSSSHPEIQQLVLTSIVSLTSQPELAPSFETFLRSFFVKSRDSIAVKMLKLKVLTNLSNSRNIALILREFQAYVNTYCAESINENSIHSTLFGSHSNSTLFGSHSNSIHNGFYSNSNHPFSDSDRFISAVITAIGDVGTRIHQVSEICLKGLISLLCNKSNHTIIAQSVIVIRTQIMNRERDSLLIKSDDFADASTESTASKDSIGTLSQVTTLIIKQLVHSKLMNPDPNDSKNNASSIGNKRNYNSAWSRARATILWILSEFCGKNLKAYQMAPDVLRKFSKSFPFESNLVKLQILNLAAKISLASHSEFNVPFLVEGQEKASLFDRDRLLILNEYLFNLAKYDLNYDIRDRARFLKSLMRSFEANQNREAVEAILFHRIEKTPKERVQKSRRGKSEFRVGTLAHFLNQQTPKYEEWPKFPFIQPDPSVREAAKEPEVIHSSATSFSSSSSATAHRREVGVSDSRSGAFNIDPNIGGGKATSTVESDLDKFYSDSDSEDEETSSGDEETSSGEEESDEEESEEETSSGEEESEDEEEEDEEEEEEENTEKKK